MKSLLFWCQKPVKGDKVDDRTLLLSILILPVLYSVRGFSLKGLWCTGSNRVVPALKQYCGKKNVIVHFFFFPITAAVTCQSETCQVKMA